MAINKEDKRLNVKELVFANLLLRGISGKDAVIEAGFSSKSPTTTAAIVSKRPHVAKYIEEQSKAMRDVVKEQLEVDEIWITKKFKEIFYRCTAGGMPITKIDETGQTQLARDENGNIIHEINDTVGAIKALENIAKHIGYYELDNKQKAPVIKVTASQTNIINFFSEEDEGTLLDGYIEHATGDTD